MKTMKQRLPVILELAEQYMTDFEDAQRKSRKFPKDQKAKRDLMNAALNMIELCQKSIHKQDKPLDPRLQMFLCGALKRVIEIYTVETMDDKHRAKEIIKAFSLEAGRGRFKDPDIEKRNVRAAVAHRRQRIGTKLGDKKAQSLGFNSKTRYKTSTHKTAKALGLHVKTVEAAATKFSEEARLNEALRQIPVRPIAK